ncbi:MAG: hypothetical protein U0165_13120 [Polyangiaceae bacterium]
MACKAAGGTGAVRFLDGRLRQPGRGITRPLRSDAGRQALPSLVSVPGSISAFSVAVALHARKTMIQIAAQGIAVAKSSDAKQRARILSRAAQAGTLVLVDKGLADAIERAAPRIDGRLLTAEDLAEVAITSSPGITLDLGDSRQAILPSWCTPDADGNPGKGTCAPSRASEVILVSDGRGVHAGVVVEQMDGLKIYDDELEMPMLAQPILRGVPKLAAGTPLESPLAIALLTEANRPMGVTAARTPAQLSFDALTKAAASVHARDAWIQGENGFEPSSSLGSGDDRLLVVG